MSTESWSLVENSPKVSKKNLKTTLKLFVLAGLGYSTRKLKTREFDEFCETLVIEKLVEKSIQIHQKKDFASGFPDPQENFVEFILAIFDFQFDAAVTAGESKPSTKGNYRSALGRWLRWLIEQIWWQELLPEQIPQVIPRRSKVPPVIRLYKKGAPYTLQPHQRTSALEAQFSEYLEFRLTDGQQEVLKIQRIERGYVPEPQIGSISIGTLKDQTETIYRLFGWYVNILGNPIDKANLSLLLDINLLTDYKNWLVYDRKTGHPAGIKLLDAVIGFAKFKYFHITKRRNFSDIEIIQNLRDMRAAWESKYAIEKKYNQAKKWPTKELSHEQLIAVAGYLKKCCAPYREMIDNSSERKFYRIQRSPSAIVNSWLTYILVLTFVFLPVRQQEVREHIIGETIWRGTDKEGNPYYWVSVMHKNYSKTLKKRTYRLPSLLTKELDTWINIIRPKAVNAVQSLEAWMNFVGFKLEDVKRLENQLKDLRQVYESIRHNESSEEPQAVRKKISSLETRLTALQNRMSSWEKAKAQLEQNPNALFFNLYDEAFGSPLSRGLLYARVKSGVRSASFKLFGYPSQTNPHAFRHIAAKHVRLLKKDPTAIAHMMGHSEEMHKGYALQIMTDMDFIDGTENHWWV